MKKPNKTIALIDGVIQSWRKATKRPNLNANSPGNSYRLREILSMSRCDTTILYSSWRRRSPKLSNERVLRLRTGINPHEGQPKSWIVRALETETTLTFARDNGKVVSMLPLRHRRNNS